MRVLVLGGFERSGHDALAAALEQVGRERGHEVVNWCWRDHIDLAEHVLFQVHHIAASRDVPWLAGVLDSTRIAGALALDLGKWVSADFDAVISVHPWSTSIANRALTDGASQSFLVDLTADFTPFPVLVCPRVDCYLGPGPHRPLPLRVRHRSLQVGLPVRKSFSGSTTKRKPGLLVVSAGAGAWLIAKTAACLPVVTEALSPSWLVALAPTVESAVEWRTALERVGVAAEVRTGITDTGPLLSDATWLLTKASGAAVAEGLAAGCAVLALESGVFWEDEARAYLSAARVVAPVAPTDSAPSLHASLAASDQRERVAMLCRRAGDDIYDVLERGLPVGRETRGERVAAEIQQRLSRERVLPASTEVTSELLADWISA